MYDPTNQFYREKLLNRLPFYQQPLTVALQLFEPVAPLQCNRIAHPIVSATMRLLFLPLWPIVHGI